MPLVEKIDEFTISLKDRRESEEKEYHNGTVHIDVVNQDSKLPYWFRQKHPFVWCNYYHLINWNNDGSRLSFTMSFSGSTYRYNQHQHVTVEMTLKSAIHLMQQLKEAIEYIEKLGELQKCLKK